MTVNTTVRILRLTARLLLITAPFMLFSGLLTANPDLVSDGFATTARMMHKAVVPAFFVPLLAIHSIMGILFLMMRNKYLNRIWMKAAAVSAWSLVFVVFGVLYFAPQAKSAENQGAGKAVVEKKCARCHGLDKVHAKTRSKQEWRSVVLTMQEKGAGLTDKEVEVAIDYLAGAK